MTNARETKLLFKPLLARHSDIFINGHMLALKPVNHLYKGIYIKRTLTKDFYSPRYVAFHLFQGWWTSIPIDSGHWIRRRTGLPGSWFHSDQVAAREFIDAAESEALPFLRKLTSLRDYYELKLTTCCLTPILHFDEMAVVVEVALGGLDRARRTFARLNPHYLDIAGACSPVSRSVAEQLVALGTHLAADDRETLAVLKKKWEQNAVKTFKLEAYWQPTSFPLEESV